MESLLLVLLGFFATQLIGCTPPCSIFGCQGHFGEPTGGDPDSPTSEPTTIETTTTTTWTEPDSFVCKEGNDAACADYLNAVYMSYDEANPSSALGVPMRGRPGYEMPWYYCTGECHEGQPDCYVPGSLLNHRLMISKNNTMQAIMVNKVYIIFQPVTALKKLIKCAWQYDGAAFGRNNGGCGNGAPSSDCDDPTSAYNDMCPEDPSKFADGDCPSVLTVSCANRKTDYPENCYWKGPAWYSPVYPGAEPDLTRLDEVNEIKEMLSQRMASQSFDVSTSDGIPLTEYWNEINIDGRILGKLLAEDASQVIAAFGYIKGDDGARGSAGEYNNRLYEQYQKKVPVISMDLTVDISKTGPFGVGEAQALML
jgi:hypothetical protein